MTPPLTDNQTTLLRACLTPCFTRDLADLLKDSGDEFGDDAARSAMKRLEERQLVVRDEHGRWVLTSAGSDALPAREDESGIRKYVVLEELRVSELHHLDPDAFVYVQVHLPDARNVEHALRQTAKSGKYDKGDEEPTLVAVATRQWKPTPVRIHTRQTVSVG